MTKAEVYKMVIDYHKKHGQGLTGIVKLGNDPTVEGHLDDLVEEGLLEIHDTGGSIGHPYSNQFYMPTKGYNVWKDGVENAPSSVSRAWRDNYFLNHVRLYLGCLEEHDEDATDLQKVINPSQDMLVKSPDFMKRYAEWLERNHKELEIMVNLDEVYVGEGIQFTDEEKELIKSRGWFEKNKTIKQCIKLSNEFVDNRKEFIKLSKKLLSINEQLNDNDEVKRIKEEIKEAEDSIAFRKKLHKWFNEQDMDSNIQDVFDNKKETV